MHEKIIELFAIRVSENKWQLERVPETIRADVEALLNAYGSGDEQ